MNVFISMNEFGHAMLETLLRERVPIRQLYTLDLKKAHGVSDFKDFRPIARKHEIPFKRVAHINEVKNEIRDLKPSHILVFGWSQLLDREFLSLADIGVLGSHPSVLPKNRGRAAIPWHIINKEKKGGLTFFYMDEGCDSGDVVAQRSFHITAKDNATSYYRRIIVEGRKAIKHLSPRLVRGEKIQSRAQNHTRATYLKKRTFKDGKIDWSQDAREILRLIRALTRPYPGAWTMYGSKTLLIDSARVLKKLKKGGTRPNNGTVVSVTKHGMVVQAGRGLLEITKMRLGKKPFSPKRISIGTRLG